MREPVAITFPDGAVRCDVGDHLLEPSDGGWRAFLVEDFVALERLVVLRRDDDPVYLVPELPDGVAPLHGGAHVMLTAFERRFSDPGEARSAIEAGALGDGVEHVCRPLAELQAATTEVVRGPTSY